MYIYDAHIYILHLYVYIYKCECVCVFLVAVKVIFCGSCLFLGQLLCVCMLAHVHEGINRGQNNIFHLYVLLVLKKKKKIKIEK